MPSPPRPPLFPYTTLFRSLVRYEVPYLHRAVVRVPPVVPSPEPEAALFNLNWLSATGSALDRKSTRLNSSHLGISYAVLWLKKKRANHRCTLTAAKRIPDH